MLVHGIPSLLSFLSPAKLPSHRRGDGREGRDLGGGACTTLLLLLLCLVNLLFHVLGGAILITNYIMHAPLARKSL